MGLRLRDRISLARARRSGDRPGWSLWDVAGKIWNSPNTALGVLYGAVGMAVGEIAHLAGWQKKAPSVRWRDNALQFTNNPLGGVGAITLGNTTTWVGDPYDPTDTVWHSGGQPILEKGHTYPEHETQHTIQGQQLGPAYLLSNLMGGLAGLIFDRDWHGRHNWNERGPQCDPPRPWRRSK